ncbi:MAG TPA: hypothetical protein VGN26_00280 [Armatimonadota bacterium]|jgi:hypothetical protein
MNTPAHGFRRLGWSGSALVLLAGLLLPVAPVSALEGAWEQISVPQGPGEIIYPYKLALDASGALYVCDLGGSQVQRRDANGQWTILAGRGTGLGQVTYPLAVASTLDGVLYVSEDSGGRVQRRALDGSWSLLAQQGDGLGQIRGSAAALAVDSQGNLYLMDGDGPAERARVQKRDASGNWSLVASYGPDGLSGWQPTTLSLGPGGSLLVAEVDLALTQSRIRSLSAEGTWSVLDGGAYGSGPFFKVLSIAVSPQGECYVSDGRVKKQVAAGQWSEVDPGAQHVFALGLAADGAGNLWVGNAEGGLLYRRAAGAWSALAPQGSDPRQFPQLGPGTLDAAGNLYVMDHPDALGTAYDVQLDGTSVLKSVMGGARSLLRFTDGAGWSVVASPSENLGQMYGPGSLAAGAPGELFGCVPPGPAFVQRRDPDGTWAFLETYSSPGTNGWIPLALAATRLGTLYTLEWQAASPAQLPSRIRKWTPSDGWSVVASPGTEVGQVGHISAGPGRNPLCTDPSGNLYVIDDANQRVQKLDARGQWSVAPGLGSANLLAVDSHGRAYVRDGDSRVVWAVEPDGTRALVTPPATPMAPRPGLRWLLVDAQDRLYLGSTWGIQRFTPASSSALKGDVNGDGKIGIQDAILCLRIVAGLLTPDAAQLGRADVAPKQADGSVGDGKVTVQDAIALLRLVAGL